MQTAESAKWYVLHTYSGYEAMVKDSLEKLVENNNLQDQIFDVRIPMEQTIEEKAGGKKKVVQRKVLPCYVFIKLIYSNNLWFLVTNTRGVTGFVGPMGKPLPLTDEEVKRMQLERVVVETDIAVGDDIKIVSGPLDSFIGKVVELNEQAQKAKVNVEMFGRATDVELDLIQLEKLNLTNQG
ncbi:MAG: transcription termination/antitermination factor NusG [Clostridia bacterium]|jgi:transcriptional antiterminator NusG|nr:transcription termination/antitermination factor NusG [Clostridia bacterium]MBQ1942520.1 transcription termination/antitermination factor NusG [Clostridia bacterium]MBQ5801748.1 transcription termination/antitermination factor NusG [Clostridia bacterium]